MTQPGRPADAEKASLDAILAASPELAAVTASVRDFAVIMNERSGRKLLEPWMTAVLAAGGARAPLLRHRPASRPGARKLCQNQNSGAVEAARRQGDRGGPGDGRLTQRRTSMG